MKEGETSFNIEHTQMNTIRPKNSIDDDLTKKCCLDVEKDISVCVVLSKGLVQVDIILIHKDEAKSVRSVTELINILIRECKIPHDKVVNEVIPWVHARLGLLRSGKI